MDRFVTGKIETGRYGNASEVVRAALRRLECEELEDEARLEALRTAIADGDASELAAGGVFARVRRKSAAAGQ
jgi:antitoxin ParD1/3/4